MGEGRLQQASQSVPESSHTSCTHTSARKWAVHEIDFDFCDGIACGASEFSPEQQPIHQVAAALRSSTPLPCPLRMPSRFCNVNPGRQKSRYAVKGPCILEASLKHPVHSLLCLQGNTAAPQGRHCSSSSSQALCPGSPPLEWPPGHPPPSLRLTWTLPV